MMHHIFISYSRRDLRPVELLVDHLVDENWAPVWIDQRDIPVSVPWMDEIGDAVRAASVFVAYDTPHWRSSQSCMIEYEIALQLEKLVVKVDLSKNGLNRTVEEIRAALGELAPSEPLRTELLVRSARWEKDDRKAGSLASGRTLTDYRRISGSIRSDVAPDVQRFIAASASRQIRRRLLTSMGVTFVVLAFFVAYLFQQAGEGAKELIKATNTTLEEATTLGELFDYNIYAALEAASTSELGEDSYLRRLRLAQALAVPVPESVERKDSSSTSEWSAANSAEVGPDGEYVASANGELAQVLIYSTSSDATLHRRVGISSPATALSWSGNGRMVAAGVAGGVEVLDIANGLVITKLRGVPGPITELSWSNEDTKVRGRLLDGSVVTWAVRTGNLILDDPSRWFMDVIAIRGSGLIAALDRDGGILLFEPETGSIVNELHTEGDVAIAMGATPRSLVVGVSSAGSASDALVVVDLDSGGQHEIPVPGCDLLDLDVDVSRNLALLACLNDGVGVVDLETSVFHTLPVDHEVIAIATASGRVMTATGYGWIMEVDVDTATSSDVVFSPCRSSARRVVIDEDGSMVFHAGAGTGAVGCAKRGVARGTAFEGDNLLFPQQGAKGSNALTLSPDGRFVSFGFSDGSLWTLGSADLNPRSIRRELVGAVRGLAYSDDGQWVAAASRNGQLIVFSTAGDRSSVDELAAEADRRVSLASSYGLYTRLDADDGPASPDSPADDE